MHLAMASLVGLGHPWDRASLAQEAAPDKPLAYKIEPPFAWNRTDRYEPPDFEKFFPDDAEAGKQLDQFLEGKLKLESVDERLALVRRGLRRTSHHRTTLLGALGNEFIWNRDPQDPRAIELLYQASAGTEPDSGVAHYALYHGPTVVLERTPNLVRMLMERYQTLDREIQGRIAWGMKTYGDKEQTRKLLLDLLDEYEKLDAATVCAALDTYQAVFGASPPNMERFDNVGLWVIAFHRTDLSANHPRAAQILRDTLDYSFRRRPTKLIDFVTRVDEGHETAVAVVQGVGPRNEFTAHLAQMVRYRIDFNEALSARTLQEKRLGEFARHLRQGPPKHVLPSYTRPPAEAKYAYSAGELVAPNFEEFFADDAEAGAKLDRAYDQRDALPMSDRELLELFRRGVRRSAHSPNTMFGWISSALGWPRDPLLTEILYQGMDPKAPPDVRSAAIYYGFGLGTSKTKNVLEALYRVYMAPPFDPTTNGNMRGRILWGVRDHEDDKHYLATRFAETLRNHAALSDEELRQADVAYRQLTDAAPPNAADYATRGVFLVMFHYTPSPSIEESKQHLARRWGDAPRLIATRSLETDGKLLVLAAVRGTAGQKWLIEELRTDENAEVYFADLLTRELIDRVDKNVQQVLRDFEKLLPAR